MCPLKGHTQGIDCPLRSEGHLALQPKCCQSSVPGLRGARLPSRSQMFFSQRWARHVVSWKKHRFGFSSKQEGLGRIDKTVKCAKLVFDVPRTVLISPTSQVTPGSKGPRPPGVTLQLSLAARAPWLCCLPVSLLPLKFTNAIWDTSVPGFWKAHTLPGTSRGLQGLNPKEGFPPASSPLGERAGEGHLGRAARCPQVAPAHLALQVAWFP